MKEIQDTGQNDFRTRDQEGIILFGGWMRVDGLLGFLCVWFFFFFHLFVFVKGKANRHNLVSVQSVKPWFQDVFEPEIHFWHFAWYSPIPNSFCNAQY